MSQENCVRWNTKTKRYELVIDGVVRAKISRLGMQIRREAAKFRQKCVLGIQVRDELYARREEIGSGECGS